MKVVFFGTPIFASKTLEAIVGAGIDIVGVVTGQDKKQGRNLKLKSNPVKIFAQEKLPDVPLFQPEKASSEESAEALMALGADLFVVVAYGQLIKPNLLDMPPKGCINVHPSLLPKYRGASPIQAPITAGDKETGVSIMYMTPELDAGDVIKQAKIHIGENTTAGEMHDELQKIGAKLLIEVLQNLGPGIPQNPELVAYAAKITPEMCKIDWNHPSLQVHNLIRGLSPFPGAYCDVEFQGELKRLKIRRSGWVEGYSEVPGAVLMWGKEGIVVSAGDGAVRLIEVQLEGKRVMRAEEFARGYSSIRFL